MSDIRFAIDPAVLGLLPGLAVAVVVARGIDNGGQPDRFAAPLRDAEADAGARLAGAEMSTHPAIAPWRDAYGRFGVKPSKFRSSIENLLRSAAGRGVRSVNPLVDIYNAVSLRHFLPCGGEDLAAIQGDVRLTRAAGDEAFVPLGGTEPDPPRPGEIVYRDDAGVICRCLNWREADRTKLTGRTSDAILFLESVPPLSLDALIAARDDLAGEIARHLGGRVEVGSVDAGQPEFRAG